MTKEDEKPLAQLIATQLAKVRESRHLSYDYRLIDTKIDPDNAILTLIGALEFTMEIVDVLEALVYKLGFRIDTIDGRIQKELGTSGTAVVP
jgi:hypothetical protein